MAAVLAPSPSHLVAPPRAFAAFHHHRGSAAPQTHRNPFDAFAPHRHSGANSRSAAASWRHSEPQAVERRPAPVHTPPSTPPKQRRTGPSHSRTPSTSSEASSTSWRSQGRAPAAAAATKADVAEQPSGPHHLKASSAFVYSAADLLRLSASPLVGISKESQDIVDDLVAHHVWRRGAQSGTPRASRRRNDRGTSKPRSLHTPTDESEHSD